MTLGMGLRVIGAEPVYIDLQVTGVVKQTASEFGLQSIILNRIQAYFDSLQIGNNFEFSDLMAYIQEVAQLENFMVEHQVRTTGTINFGVFTANKTRNADYSTSVLTDSNDLVVWRATDPGAEYTTNTQQVVIGGLNEAAASGSATLQFQSSGVNVLSQPYHKMRMGMVNIHLTKDN